MQNSQSAVKYIYLRRGYLVCRAAGQCRPRPRPPGHCPRRGRAVCRALGGRPRRGGEERGAAQLTGMVRHYSVDTYLCIYNIYLSTRYLGRHRPLLPIPEEEVRCGGGEARRCPEPHEVAAADPLQGGRGGRHRAFRGASTS